MAQFANFGRRVEPYTISTRQLLWVPSFGERKHLNLKKRCREPFKLRNYLKVPNFGERNSLNFTGKIDPRAALQFFLERASES